MGKPHVLSTLESDLKTAPLNAGGRPPSVERAWGFPTLSQRSQLQKFVLLTPVVRAPRSVTPRRRERETPAKFGNDPEV